MTQYLYSISILFMTVICMLFLTVTNEYILPAHKKGFIAVFFGTSFITVCEVMSIFLNGSDVKYTVLHFLSNFIGFFLTPSLIMFFAASIGRFHRLKWAIVGMIGYSVLCSALAISKQLFFIDAQNNYHRGNLFFVYIISYFLAVLYLLFETFRYSSKGFFRHKIFAIVLSCFFLVASSIQVVKPEVYTTRIAVTLSLCVFYAYNNELTNLFDKLTGILNQGTYLKKIKELKAQQVVIILDIDDFKGINDKFGHQSGDKCLSTVAKSIKSIFWKYGQCYRIGGDEFAIVIRKNNKVDSLIANFEKTVDSKFKSSPYQVSISIGYSKFENGDTYEDVIRRADLNMYNVKNSRKAMKSVVADSK